MEKKTLVKMNLISLLHRPNKFQPTTRKKTIRENLNREQKVGFMHLLGYET